jgi:hypothetical protein
LVSFRRQAIIICEQDKLPSVSSRSFNISLYLLYTLLGVTFSTWSPHAIKQFYKTISITRKLLTLPPYFPPLITSTLVLSFETEFIAKPHLVREKHFKTSKLPRVLNPARRTKFISRPRKPVATPPPIKILRDFYDSRPRRINLTTPVRSAGGRPGRD